MLLFKYFKLSFFGCCQSSFRSVLSLLFLFFRLVWLYLFWLLGNDTNFRLLLRQIKRPCRRRFFWMLYFFVLNNLFSFLHTEVLLWNKFLLNKFFFDHLEINLLGLVSRLNLNNILYYLRFLNKIVIIHQQLLSIYDVLIHMNGDRTILLLSLYHLVFQLKFRVNKGKGSFETNLSSSSFWGFIWKGLFTFSRIDEFCDINIGWSEHFF